MLNLLAQTGRKRPFRRIYWKAGKDTGYFDDMKTLKGALKRIQRRIPQSREHEVCPSIPTSGGEYA